ncbi:MarR family transcriptional regulator [Streptomyces sp. NPDC012751]|uniref:MarR family transcriptional regulator n=1 Tax=Streptomyces sp. NPDC012751 TaxID=3364846 RepID=UPI0036C2EC76
MSEAPRWLNPVEERAWRGMLRMHDLPVNQAGRTLQSESGLSATDYAVPAEPTRARGDRLRIAGRSAMEAAAPQHVEDVRHLFLDHLSPGRITLLAEITDTVLAKIDTDR